MKRKNILSYLQQPHAVAIIKGSSKYPQIRGSAKFFQTKEGVWVSVRVSGLPVNNNSCQKPIFAMHIHSGSSCTGNSEDPFADAKTHYNPDRCLHPYHAGDIPPVFGANGVGVTMFLTDRFTVREIIGKSIVIHSKPDDFTSQPAGNSGDKIACGVIEKEWMM